MNTYFNGCRTSALVVFFSVFFTSYAFSQSASLSGLITDSANGKPLLGASVFLGNTSLATQSLKDGDYNLRNIPPGTYDLFVKFLGYEIYQKQIVVDAKDQTISVGLRIKSTEIKEVAVSGNQRKNYLQLFISEFIGDRKDVKLMNPEVVDLGYEGKVFKASSEEFLIIENRYLGYRLKFLLTVFERHSPVNMTGKALRYYEGTALFEELKGSVREIKRWKKNRRSVYQGSSMHLYRSLGSNRLDAEGFAAHHLKIIPNPSRPADSLIKRKIAEFSSKIHLHSNDSLTYWNKQKDLPEEISILYKTPINQNEICRQIDNGLYELKFPYALWIKHNKKVVGSISLRDGAANFDQNGVITNPRSIIYQGSWAFTIGSLLPQNYQEGN